MTPRAVSETVVVRILHALGAAQTWRRTYPETAAGIARAANTDPLFVDLEEGAELTACILVAAAWEASRLHPYAPGVSGVGLFRIRPPSEPRLRANLLTLPRSAAREAVRLMRTSSSVCTRMPWEERLAWYFDLGSTHLAPSTEARRRSSAVLVHAKQLFLHYFELGPLVARSDESSPLLHEPNVLEYAS